MEQSEEEMIFDNEELSEQMEEADAATKRQDDKEWLDAAMSGQQSPETLFGLFKDVLKTDDSSKLGNLNTQELGNLTISVRGCKHLHKLGHQFGHKTFGDFFKDQGEILLSTSASKKGWQQELFVTAKKFNQKSVGSAATAEPKKSSWSWKSMMGGSNPQPQQQAPSQ